jgi:hypothetical protein
VALVILSEAKKLYVAVTCALRVGEVLRCAQHDNRYACTLLVILSEAKELCVVVTHALKAAEMLRAPASDAQIAAVWTRSA